MAPSPAATRRFEEGFTLIELLLVVTIIGIVAAIAIPGLSRARGAAAESSTIGSLRVIHGAQVLFSVSCGGGYYAPTIAVLATKPAGATTAFIGPEFAADVIDREEYRIRFTLGALVATAPATCNGIAKGRTVNTFFVAADLLQTNSARVSRYFGLNSSGVIFQSSKRVPVTLTGNPPAPAKPL